MPQGKGTYGSQVGRPPNPDKTFKKQIRQEAREKFKGGQILKKLKFKKKKKQQYKKDWEEGSWQ
tara:strand:- start:246 stop:437 length:192 start_codon:yes stop_codon:yes gene_type:complete